MEKCVPNICRRIDGCRVAGHRGFRENERHSSDMTPLKHVTRNRPWSRATFGSVVMDKMSPVPTSTGMLISKAARKCTFFVSFLWHMNLTNLFESSCISANQSFQLCEYQQILKSQYTSALMDYISCYGKPL